MLRPRDVRSAVALLGSMFVVHPADAQVSPPEPPRPPAEGPVAPTAPGLEERLAALEARALAADAEAAAAKKELAELRASVAAAAKPAPLAPVQPKPEPKPEPVITLGGYAEAFYQWNANDPANGITNFRGFDNRHNSFTLSNAVLDGQVAYAGAQARVALQFGHTPSTYYLAEPVSPGASGANSSSGEVFKYVQQAYGGYEFDVLKGLLVQAGIFLSPIGPEGIAVKDGWCWSRSNLFFGLPFYHTGIHTALKLTDEWSVGLGVVNGWNNVVDNNRAKSGHARVTYTDGTDFTWTFLYFGGIERNLGLPEGSRWRSTFDTHLTWQANDWFALQPHFDVGFEPTEFGTSHWIAGALAARFRLFTWDREPGTSSSAIYVAGRADAFYENAASDDAGDAGRIFWPVSWVASQTATVEARLVDHVSFRLEYRHDQAADDMFFAGQVEGDGVATPFVPDSPSQSTVTIGATAWF